MSALCDPFLELWCHACHVKTVEEVAGIQGKRLHVPTRTGSLKKLDGVAPETGRTDGQRLVSNADDACLAKCASEKMHCLTQCTSRTDGVGVWPELRQNLVTTPNAADLRQREIDEHCDALRLRRKRGCLRRVAKSDRAKSAQFDHPRSPCRDVAPKAR